MTALLTSGSAAHGGIRIRRAAARDAKRLTRLVRTSRAYRGPYESMVAGYRVGPDYIEHHEVYVAEAGAGRARGQGKAREQGQEQERKQGQILGFYALVLDPPELDLMFVADAAQGLGIGRLLIAHLTGRAREAGLTEVRIVSHPPAEGFYRSVGAVPVGMVPANPPAVLWDRPELVIRLRRAGTEPG